MRTWERKIYLYLSPQKNGHKLTLSPQKSGLDKEIFKSILVHKTVDLKNIIIFQSTKLWTENQDKFLFKTAFSPQNCGLKIKK